MAMTPKKDRYLKHPEVYNKKGELRKRAQKIYLDLHGATGKFESPVYNP